MFRLHLNTEPTSLSPLDQRSSSSAFLLSQLHAPLLWIENGKLIPLLGNCKQTKKTHIHCDINKKAKFSNGKAVLGQHFLNVFYEYLNHKKPGLRADLLLSIKNAKKILKGNAPKQLLGVKVKNRSIDIELENPDLEFIYNLANPLLAPQYSSRSKISINQYAKLVTSGPYKIKSWEPKHKIHLVPNPYFFINKKNNIKRPDVEFYFISEDSTALSLYEKNELDFLRRLPTLYISKYKDHPDFHAIDQFRFDYFGFGPQLKEKPLVRKFLSESLNYENLRILYSAKPRPGCSGVPMKMTEYPICHDFYQKTFPDNMRSDFNNITFIYSKQGGDDHKRTAEWAQAEWKKNLGIQIEIKPIDNKIFITELNGKTPIVFRKGLAPDRPTCLSILENFKTNAAENLIQLSDKKFDNIVDKMKITQNLKNKIHLCHDGLELLIKDYHLIPLGPIYFSILVKPQWTGWSLNELNQLSLVNLQYQKQ